MACAESEANEGGAPDGRDGSLGARDCPSAEPSRGDPGGESPPRPVRVRGSGIATAVGAASVDKDQKGRSVMGVRWWLVFLLGGVLLVVVRHTLVGGVGQFLVFCLGVLFVVLALFRRAGGQDYH